MVKTKYSILTNYQNNVQAQQTLIEVLKKKINNISLSRLGLFVSEILIVAMIISFGFSYFLLILTILPVFIFLLLVKKQSAVQIELDYARQLLWVYQNEVDHLTLGINKYQNGDYFNDESHPYASDLDITGTSSLFSFINRCNTHQGLNTLVKNLLQPSLKDLIVQRQDAIAELTAHIDQTFHFRAQLQNHKPEQLALIKKKLTGQLPDQLLFTHNKMLRSYVKAVPFITIGLLLLGSFLGGYLWQIFGFVAVINAGVTFFYLGRINLVYYGFTGSSNLLNAFSGIIKWTEEVRWKSVYINQLFDGTNSSPTDQTAVSHQIKQLARIIQAFDARLNIIVSMFLNLFFLWDLKCSIRLDQWHSQSSTKLIAGLSRISHFEELISFATLTHNQPEWNFPAVSNQFRLKAVALGHPLIHEEERVVNDFELERLPTVDIVTGSNMAGKSTFLRTVGINMVLAYAGAPVCAKEMEVSIFSLLSYMRIKDSLNDHTSTFKAELNRLKMILDATVNQPNSFVLIDEMLRGTNSKDKYLGSKVFIEKLIQENTPALFATHDLQLSEMQADYPEKIRNYHFDIQITMGEMNFDYKLKQGPCKTFNAALLLKEIGLTLS